MSIVYTFDYNFAMVTLVSISFILNLITVLNLLLALFPPNSCSSKKLHSKSAYSKKSACLKVPTKCLKERP